MRSPDWGIAGVPKGDPQVDFGPRRPDGLAGTGGGGTKNRGGKGDKNRSERTTGFTPPFNVQRAKASETTGVRARYGETGCGSRSRNGALRQSLSGVI